MELDPRTPVLVGAGLVTQREEDPQAADEALALMIRATHAAGLDAGTLALLSGIERAYVPIGRWQYRNPGRLVATAVGSPTATSVSALAGVSQQTILSAAATAIASGEITTALVVGGEAGHRLQRAHATGLVLVDTVSTDLADVVMKPHDPMLPDYEQATGLGSMPVGYYAILESAWRHAAGVGTDRRRDDIATRYHRFSKIAAANPHGWDDDVVAADTIRNERMLAFPYTTHHVSNWSVDQASALLICSVSEAQRLGIHRSKWVFPHVFTEANHMVNITARGDLHRCVGAEMAAHATLEAAGCTAADLDFVELYSCFPVAVDVFAAALGIADHAGMSFTGGMPFAGGPFNNFVLHATAQLAHQLRTTPGGRGLITTVSGVLTKQGVAIWGTDPSPTGYTSIDVTPATAAATEERTVDPQYRGRATIAGYTRLHRRGGAPPRGVAVLDLPNGQRSIASTDDDSTLAAMEREELCGRSVNVVDRVFELIGDSDDSKEKK
jgi:acetyl-CoA C-acetyltransferase